jgi:hypothetical protein
MTKTYRFENELSAPLGKVQELLTDPGVREEEATQVAGALEAHCDLEERGNVKELVVHQKEHGYSLEGKRDTSKVEDVTLTITWNTDDFRGEWKWRMASQKDRVRVDGSTTLLENDDTTKVVEEGRVDVKIPMVGRVVEGKIVKGLEEARPDWVSWMRGKL